MVGDKERDAVIKNIDYYLNVNDFITREFETSLFHEKELGFRVFFFHNFIYLLFIYFGLHCVFVAMHGLSLVAASEGDSSLRCEGFSLRWLRGARALGAQASVVVMHGLSCSAACGIFLDQGLNPCPLR